MVLNWIYPLTVSSGNFSLPYDDVTDLELRQEETSGEPWRVDKDILRFAEDLDRINEAMWTLYEGKMRCRGVLDVRGCDRTHHR